MLTNRMRTAKLTGGQLRGAVRFVVRLRPTVSEWQNYRAGSVEFEDLAWPQCAAASGAGVRQTWCAIELQMHAGPPVAAGQPTSRDAAIPFFGSAALYSSLER